MARITAGSRLSLEAILAAGWCTANADLLAFIEDLVCELNRRGLSR